MISSDTSLQPTVAHDEARALFGQTMGLVAVTSALFALGAYLGRDMSTGWGSSRSSPRIGVLLGLNVAISRSEQLAIGLLFGFGVLIGLGTAPMIAYYASTNPQSVWQAGGGDGALHRGLRRSGVRDAPRPLRRWRGCASGRCSR